MTPAPLPPRRLAAVVAVLGALVALPATTAQGSLGEVADLFARGRYADARESMAALDDTADPADRLWRQRLQTEPDRAVELALDQVRDRELPLPVRIQAALDGASIELARQRPEAAWQMIEPLLATPPEQLPGDLHLLAGQALRLRGRRQQAREMLASVRPDDPAFAAARELLGRVGLESGDSELALRYFESAERRTPAGGRPELQAGRWQALRLLARDVEARDVARRLHREHPSSLAALEVGDIGRREQEDLAILADTLDTLAPEVLDEPSTGRYTVQLAAFRDRALALQFVARWQAEIADLAVTEQADDLGQPIYKVQTGAFVSPAMARTEASRLSRQHGLDGFVTESAR